ncbi:MAG: DNA-protecting protein DprA [Hamadaea sp.]|uniref:DNA-processing protein DprA n=1 Tax=Hamadaea sp. TaxID=2024425 RepID=UPI00183ACCE5|nr:DNA-processing protein DprA [Hamadaea sp.]NUR70803.1 DNA-protecting protein DprA [Hamadaea sp.]NUT20164.1 DNA-protecting protein DprA [Hamadaea sp.]
MNEHRVRLARVALGCLVEPGRRDLFELVSTEGPEGALTRLCAGDAAAAEVVRSRLAGGDPRELARRQLAAADRAGVRVLTPEDLEWPGTRLADLARISRPTLSGGTAVDRDTFPPQCLWVRGTLPLAATVARSVAVVGARASTPYGDHVAAELSYNLVRKGYAVVSGGAFGIDAAAHRGALAAGGPTIAVLACGVDRAYPMGHAGLLEQISEAGLVLSEWPLGSEPLRFRFLIRNRVIAALTQGTVMVEAAARSGSRQTLHRALQLGRAAMAVPGQVTSATSVGCHEELRKPEVLAVANVAHVLEEIGRIGADLAPPVLGPERPEDQLDEVESRLMDAVPTHRPMLSGEIARIAGIPVRVALAKLPALVTKGLLEERGGAYRLPANRADRR